MARIFNPMVKYAGHLTKEKCPRKEKGNQFRDQAWMLCRAIREDFRKFMGKWN